MDAIRIWWGSRWRWFAERAHGSHAIFWLGFCAFFDPIFFPIAPEIYLVALMLARKDVWRRYLPVAILFSTLGATAGYFVGAVLFNAVGAPLIAFYGLGGAFMQAQHSIEGRVFLAMLLVPFTLIPEKVFVFAAGFLGASFPQFLLGFFIGRSIRLALITYLTERYGAHIIDILNRYFLVFMLVLLALIGIYATVHWHLLPL